MKTKEISLKHKIVYGIIVLLVTMLLLLNNEGGQPLEYTGSELQHSVGLIDSENSLVIRESVARTGCIANTPQYVMNKGTYTVSMDYKVDYDGSVLELWGQGSKMAAWPVPTGQQKMSVDFTLSKDVKQLQFKTNYSGQGELTIKKFTLAPKGMFYSDTYFFVVLFAVINVVGCLYVRNGRKWLTQEQLVDYSIILGVALLATSPMMQTYLYNGDDLCYHLARLEGLKDGILDGQIPVNILPDGLKNHGYLNAMYPYLFLYIGAFLRICRVSSSNISMVSGSIYSPQLYTMTSPLFPPPEAPHPVMTAIAAIEHTVVNTIVFTFFLFIISSSLLFFRFLNFLLFTGGRHIYQEQQKQYRNKYNGGQCIHFRFDAFFYFCIYLRGKGIHTGAFGKMCNDKVI